MRVLFLLALCLACSACADNSASRTSLIDDFSDLNYPDHTYPKLTTPQWVGEKGVDAVLVLAIDDMREPPKYESYLRPILDRLKAVDGRAPLSIMTCNVNPQDPQLQKWLQEGLSLEVHTVDHPCPILDKGNFGAAKMTYDRCVDLLFSIPNNRPVGFRTPCMDGINSASPRLYSEILMRTTTNGNFLTCGSSVGILFDEDDPELPKDLLTDQNGKPRFAKHLPPGWVNYIKNYPYPYVVGSRFWELTFSIPDDYQASRVAGDKSPKTVADMKAAIDLTVLKKGIWVMTFHPYNWIDNKQVVELIDHAVAKYGSRVKFLNMREVQERIDRNLLAGQPLRGKNGEDNGVRLLDLNKDGYLDVIVANDNLKQTRIWDPKTSSWTSDDFPTEIATGRGNQGVRFGFLKKAQSPFAFVSNEKISGFWNFDGEKWIEQNELTNGLDLQTIRTAIDGKDRGVRLRDLDGDGICELIVSNPGQNKIYSWNPEQKKWSESTLGLPSNVSLVTQDGVDNGVRFIDLNKDGAEDLIFSNAAEYGLWLHVPTQFLGFQKGFSRQILRGKRGETPEIPMIVRGGEFPDNGAFFKMDNLWLQNEDTTKFTNLLQKVPYTELLNGFQQPAKSPQEGLVSIEVAPNLEVQLVASEPLIEDPVNFEWGADGSLWVVEMHDYPTGVNGKPAGIIKKLKDNNGDGVYDEAVVFLDKLNFPNGLIPWRDGVIFSAAPEIVYASDSDGDGHADKKEVLFTGFIQGNQQHRINGFEIGLDNWIYGANGDSGGDIVSKKTGKRVNIRGRDIRFNPDTGELQTVSGGTQFGRRHDDWGNWFGGANYTWGWNYYVQEHYLARNPNLAVRSTYRPYSTDPDGGRVFPISRVQQRFNDVGMAGHVTSACSFAPYRDEIFEGDFQNSIFISEPAHNLVHREVLVPDGVSFNSHRATNEQTNEFLASRDPWFRPTTIKTGPDGALYIADMYRLVIEHPEWIPADVQNRMNLRAGDDKGRIYRVKPKNKSLRPFHSLSKLAGPELARSLDSPNGWTRDTVQRLLLERQDKAAMPALRDLFLNSAKGKVRLQALCILDGLKGLDSDLLVKGLNDPISEVREHSLRLTEPALRQDHSVPMPPTLLQAFLSKVNDPEIRVRYQLCFSLGEWDNQRAAEYLAMLALKDNDSDAIATAVLSSSSHFPELLLERLLSSTTQKSDKLIQTLTKQVAQNDSALEGFASKILNGAADDKTKVQILGAVLRNSVSGQAYSSPQWQAFFEKTRSLLKDSAAPEPLRKSAIYLVGIQKEKSEDDSKLLSALITSENSPELQEAAITRLGEIKAPKVARDILNRFSQASPKIRNSILALLLRREEWVSELVNQLEDGAILAIDVGPTVQQQLLSQSSTKLRKRAEKVFAATSSNANRNKLVDNNIDQIRQLSGNLDHGRTLFDANCATCHKAGNIGFGAGPNLAMLYDRGPEQIVTAILDPNRAVEDKYRNYTIELKNGEQLSGILLNESGNSITLMTITGTEQPILRREISSMKTDNRSMMPEGFESILKPQDISDLIAFLHSTTLPPRSFPGNSPELVKEQDRILHLTASKAEIHGRNIAFESQYQNLGLWNSESDRAIWLIELSHGGNYEVWMDFACHSDTAGNKFIVETGGARLTGEVSSTGTWEDYTQKKIGSIELTPGRHRISMRAAPGLHGHLIDLRELVLVPVGSRPIFAGLKPKQ
jgi:putative membrane-bound dehydrogenase-like protein